MQQRGCNHMRLLLSRYADGEATPAEREQVEQHVASCEECACTLTSYIEVAAILGEAGMRPPDPEVRDGVFRQIRAIREEQIHREPDRLATSERRRHQQVMWPALNSLLPAGPGAALVSRLWRIASPLALGGAAMFALLTVITLIARTPITDRPDQRELEAYPIFPSDVPTAAAPALSDFPPPVETKVIAAPPPQPRASVSAVVQATSAIRKELTLRLTRPTPVFEYGEPSDLSDWHVLRDPTYGYIVSYPPNWWTSASYNTRYFLPWNTGGTRYAPYWIDIQVEPNSGGMDAFSYNQTKFDGKCEIVHGGKNGAPCLRRITRDASNVYYELYGFGSKNIYRLRLVVPGESVLAGFEQRWKEGQAVFMRMSQNIALGPETVGELSGYNSVLFLNGTDLWMVGLNGEGARPVTRGYGVRAYAKSPDTYWAAFTATANPALIWGEQLYLAPLEPTDPANPMLLWSGADIYDIAWYSDRELLAIARTGDVGFGLYRLTLRRTNRDGGMPSLAGGPELLLKLGDDMVGARGLAVAPDRQLISFLAPLGENKGTGIYAVRPDGTDLMEVVSYADPLAPSDGQASVLSPANQAIKSYVWLDGRLEYGSYSANLLFTCGNSSSPTLFRGGFLYLASSASNGPLLDPSRLGLPDASDVRIVHVAYSPQGRVAFTGFYNYRDLRVEVLAGLWTANLTDSGTLTDLRSQPAPARPNGIADLEWSPDGRSLIYRETFPISDASLVSRYEGNGFLLVKQDVYSGERVVLYDASRR